ncbi:CzcA family heavy metal efflux pump [Alicycliphilus sp. B1]|nr:CzcA family heavy metal efflux pump [Alicycliphilus sp. B1]
MQPMIDGVQDKLSGAHSDLTVKVFGDDLAEVRGVANRLADVLKQVSGSADVAVDVEPPLAQPEDRARPRPPLRATASTRPTWPT